MTKSLIAQLTFYVISNKNIHDSNLHLYITIDFEKKKKKTVLACTRV